MLAETGHRAVEIGGSNPGIISTGNDAVNLQYQAEQATVLPPEALLPPSDIDAPQGLARVRVSIVGDDLAGVCGQWV